MIKNDSDKVIAPRDAAKTLIDRRLMSFVNDEDIPEVFTEATEEEIERIGNEYWRIVFRISETHLKLRKK